MAATQLRSVSNTAPRSQQRDALAEAIELHDEAKRQLAANESAREQTTETIHAARRAFERATAAVDEAKVNAARHLTDTVIGTARAAPLSVKDAQVAAQDAEDALEAAVTAQAALVEHHKAATRELQYARMSLDMRVTDVMKAEVPVEKLVADYVVLQRELVSQRRALQWLDLQGVVPRGTAWQGEHDWPDLPGAAPWKLAAAALGTDADAPLPV